VKAGKHGVVVEANGAKHKVFWDELESVKKAGKHGESTGRENGGSTPERAGASPAPAEPDKAHAAPGKKPNLGPGLVDPVAAHGALEAAGWKAAHLGSAVNSYEHPDHPGHVIGLSDEGAWAHNRFNVKLPKGIPGNPAYPPKDKGGPGKAEGGAPACALCRVSSIPRLGATRFVSCAAHGTQPNTARIWVAAAIS